MASGVIKSRLCYR